MTFNHIRTAVFAALGFTLAMSSCQKEDRPKMGEIQYDPEPPAYSPLKSWWAFENNVNDASESKLTGVARNVTYGAGITGQAAMFNKNGYVQTLVNSDTTRQTNGFVTIPKDTLSNPGSFSVAFWMNSPTVVQGGAQTVFAIADKSRFWGHFQIFLENYDNIATPNAIQMKIHLYNDNVTTGQEQWVDVQPAMTFANATGSWMHIAVSYDAATSSISLYRNGVVTGVNNRVLNGGNYGRMKFNTFGGIVWGTWPNLTVPSMTTGNETWPAGYQGGLDQARIYTKALTAAEVTELYNSKQ